MRLFLSAEFHPCSILYYLCTPYKDSELHLKLVLVELSQDHMPTGNLLTCQLVASYPGSRLIKCVGEEGSLVSTALRFKRDPRYSSVSGFHCTLSHHAWVDDIISCQVSIKSYCGDG